MNQTGRVVAYFASRTDAEEAINELKDAGFTHADIGLAIRSGEYGTGMKENMKGKHPEAGAWERIKEFFGAEPSDAPEGYRSDDVDESLNGLAINDEQTRYFRHRFDSGNEGAIVTVSAAGREAEAQRLLEENGGDLGTSASTYDYGEAETTPRSEVTADDRSAEQRNIQLYGEVLRVHKDRVSRGEARLRKEVHTSTQKVEVPITREELVVERVPVSGEQAADSASFEENEVRIPLSEERARVEKQPVIREEVRVGKKAVSDVETFDEQVRSEDIKVDQDVSKQKRKSA